MSERPMMLIDIDGPLNPYLMSNSVAKSAGYKKGRSASGWAGCRVRLNPAHGPMLLGFAEHHGLDLVWATMWEEAANIEVGLPIGLPLLPHISFSHSFLDGRYWKYKYVLDYCEGRDLVWVDDEFTLHGDELYSWFWDERLKQGRKTLLVEVSPKTGLTIEHLALTQFWLKDRENI